jgi:hypothetical protein
MTVEDKVFELLEDFFQTNPFSIKQYINDQWKTAILIDIINEGISNVTQLNKDLVEKWARVHMVEFGLYK